jgi:ribosomal protein L30/L7E
MANAERFTAVELDTIRLAIMHTRVYVKDDKATEKMLDKLQAKVERFIIGRGRKVQEV